MSKPLALIIEDDQDQSFIFNEALKHGGFETEIFQDGRLALDRLAAIIPDLVLLDLHLPHLSGKEILTKIRADARLANTQVILATADPLLAESLHDEANLTLLKPISFKQLKDLATRLVTQSGSRS